MIKLKSETYKGHIVRFQKDNRIGVYAFIDNQRVSKRRFSTKALAFENAKKAINKKVA